MKTLRLVISLFFALLLAMPVSALKSNRQPSQTFRHRSMILSQGPFYPTQASQGKRFPEGVEWTDLAKILAEDSDYSTANFTDLDQSKDLVGSGFNFSIPISATITGIRLEIKQLFSSGDGEPDVIPIIGTDNHSALVPETAFINEWPTSETWVSYGGQSDLWFSKWTAGEINSAGFFGAIASHAWDAHLNVDAMRITVYYLPKVSDPSLFSQGPLYPATAASVSSSLAVAPWTDPDNIFADDDAEATRTLGGSQHTSDYLFGGGFRFSIPLDATVVGILVEIKADATFSGHVPPSGTPALVNLAQASSEDTPRIASAVSPYESDFGASYPGYAQYGSIDDLWGVTWKPQEINSDDFGAGFIVDFSGASCAVAVDAIRVTVFFLSHPIDVFETKPPLFQPRALANLGDGFFHIEPGDSKETRRRKLNAGFTLAEYRINLIERAVEAGKIVPPQGSQGVQGARGGNVGSQGSQGSQGGRGAVGVQGGPGSQGAVGVQGLQGSRGQPGNYGVIGDVGNQGPPGSQGSPGVQGTKGVKGSTGATGNQGIQGSPGIQGPQGLPGAGVNGYAASSVSSVLMNAGSRTFTTQTGLAYLANQRVRLAVRTSPSSYMEGTVTSYTGSSLVVSVDRTTGFGTFADWTINLAGLVGLTGEQGPQGVPGGDGPPGDVGIQGGPGPQGSQGTGSSPVGSTGAQGPTGTPGPGGRQGRPGRDDHGFGS